MKTPLSLITLVSFLITGIIGSMPAHAQELSLPTPGTMVHLSPQFNPPLLRGIKVHPDNPFRFDFILDKGDSDPKNDQLKEESARLIKYFLASLTTPEKDLWVNLSPYEKDRIIPNSFGLTEMGRDLLAEDYMLKQITASLIYPEDEVGKKFWKRVYEEADKKFGTTNIPVNTFNKVWIIPEKAVVYENAKAGTAYVVESRLKVMLEQDYLALSHNIITPKAGIQDTSTLSSQIVREIVIPELTKEINEGKSFAQLRQIYNSLILATWYKKKIKHGILSQVYTDKNKTAGIDIYSSLNKQTNKQTNPSLSLSGLQDGPQIIDPQLIYQRYLQAFKKGVYNYIKEELNPLTQETIPRKYFSGGMNISPDAAMSIIQKAPVLYNSDRTLLLQAGINLANSKAPKQKTVSLDRAMNTESLGIKLRGLTMDEQPLGNFSLESISAAEIQGMEKYYKESEVATISDKGEVKIVEPSLVYLQREFSSSYKLLIRNIQKIIPSFKPINIVLHGNGGEDAYVNRLRFGRPDAFLPVLREIDKHGDDTSYTFGFRDRQGNVHMSMDLFTQNPYDAEGLWEDIATQVVLSLILQQSQDKLQEISQAIFKRLSFSEGDLYHTNSDAFTHLSLLQLVPSLVGVHRQIYESGITRTPSEHVASGLAYSIHRFGNDNISHFLNDWAPRIFPPEFNLYLKDYILQGSSKRIFPYEQIRVALLNWAIFSNTSYYEELLPIFNADAQKISSLIQGASVSHDDLIHHLYEGNASVENPRIVFVKMQSLADGAKLNFLLGQKLVEDLPPHSLLITSKYDKDKLNVKKRKDIEWMDESDNTMSNFDKNPIEVFKNRLKARIKKDGITHILVIDDGHVPGQSWDLRENPSRNDKNPFHEALKEVSGNNARFALQIDLPHDTVSLHEAYLTKRFSAVQGPLPADIAVMPIHTWPGDTNVYGHYPDGIFVTTDDRDGPNDDKIKTPEPRPSNSKPLKDLSPFLFQGTYGWSPVAGKGLAVAHKQGQGIEMSVRTDKSLGGIDLTSDKALQVKNSGESIKFKIDPVMLQQLQNASGFVPVIINIQPMSNLQEFLGINSSVVQSLQV